eukprot:scaffold9861_cov19-Tisochrysis_lutea.AAC.1
MDQDEEVQAAQRATIIDQGKLAIMCCRSRTLSADGSGQSQSAAPQALILVTNQSKRGIMCCRSRASQPMSWLSSLRTIMPQSAALHLLAVLQVHQPTDSRLMDQNSQEVQGSGLQCNVCKAKHCHFLHRFAHPSQWALPPARSFVPPRSIGHHGMKRQPKSSQSPGALVVWCKFEHPPFAAKMGVKQPQSHKERSHVAISSKTPCMRSDHVWHAQGTQGWLLVA